MGNGKQHDLAIGQCEPLAPATGNLRRVTTGTGTELKQQGGELGTGLEPYSSQPDGTVRVGENGIGIHGRHAAGDEEGGCQGRLRREAEILPRARRAT